MDGQRHVSVDMPKLCVWVLPAMEGTGPPWKTDWLRIQSHTFALGSLQ